MSILESNLEALNASHPYIGARLSLPPDEFLVIEQSHSGSPTAKHRGSYVHSRHDPVREAAQLVSREVADDTSVAVFYGFGLGYHLEAFLALHPGVPAIVVEPDPGFFLKALESRDMKMLFSDSRIRFFLEDDPESLAELLDEMPISKIQVIKIRSVHAKDERFYARADGVIQSYLARKEVNLNTLRRFGKRWVTNLAWNLGMLVSSPGINSAAGSLRGIPALVLASGPSLEAVLPLLCELRKRCAVVSVDTSLNACLREGVEPDILVVVDPQYWNTRHVDWANPKKAVLVSEPSTHPRVFRLLGLPAFFSSSFFPLGAFFESIAGEKGKIGAGGSVATASWDIARVFGLDPIYMAGLDLGYPQAKTHFKGAFFEQAFHNVSNKLAPMETREIAYLLEADPFYVSSNSGGLVLTDKRMQVYKWWFETQMRSSGDTETCNLASHGVRINGMEHKNLHELLALPVIRERIDEKMARIREAAIASDTKRLEEIRMRMSEAIESLLPELKRLSIIAEEGLKETEAALLSISGGRISQEALSRLSAVDEKIRSESSRLITGFLLQPIIQGIVHSAKGESADMVLDTTERLYRELRESAEFHYDVLNRAKAELGKKR